MAASCSNNLHQCCNLSTKEFFTNIQAQRGTCRVSAANCRSPDWKLNLFQNIIFLLVSNNILIVILPNSHPVLPTLSLNLAAFQLESWLYLETSETNVSCKACIVPSQVFFLARSGSCPQRQAHGNLVAGSYSLELRATSGCSQSGVRQEPCSCSK